MGSDHAFKKEMRQQVGDEAAGKIVAELRRRAEAAGIVLPLAFLHESRILWSEIIRTEISNCGEYI